jgi:hypothetical protein
MSRISRYLFILPILLLFAQTAQAHSFASAADLPKNNVIKLNFSSLAFGNASFQYERIFAGRMSFAMGVSYMPETGLPFANLLMDQFGHNDDARRAIETTRLSVFSLTPEIRFYLSKNAPSGVYLAPFARYTMMEMNQVYAFTASNGLRYYPDVDGSLNYIAGGLLFGYQFLLGKHFNIDLWIAGPYIGSMNGSFVAIDYKADMNETIRNDLKRDIESFEIPLVNIEATVDKPNQVDVILSGGVLGIRAMGFAVGFRF